ncbi:MAG: response regulator [Proteobacteria bacterium]|nr:response regulator [Pseudomonadota bacterium]
MGQEETKLSLEDLMKAAKAGDASAQKSLAMLHELGLIPGATMKEALRLYLITASKDPLSALFVANFLQNGAEGILADQKAADAYFELAEKGGFRPAHKRVIEAANPVQKTVLLVGDSPVFRVATHKLLLRKGYLVVDASDASQALQVLQSDAKIDLVLSDVELPKVSGITLLSDIRRRLKRKSLRVVMLTTERKVEVLKEAIQLGVNGWVLRPCDNETLLKAIKRALAA